MDPRLKRYEYRLNMQDKHFLIKWSKSLLKNDDISLHLRHLLQT
jgi:hypothetical protein